MTICSQSQLYCSVSKLNYVLPERTVKSTRLLNQLLPDRKTTD